MAPKPREHEERLERIVREVIARLDYLSESPRVSAITRVTSETTENAKDTEAVEQQTITERVITVDLVQARLHGVRRVCVSQDAIITPAAQDLLRDAGVRLVREARRSAADGRMQRALAVGVAECANEPAAMPRLTEVYGGAIEHVARTGLVDVIREITEQVVLGGSKGVLVTDSGSAAVCLANRRAGVRAVLARRVEDIEADVEAVAANLLVIEPARLSTWQQLRAVKALVSCESQRPLEL